MVFTSSILVLPAPRCESSTASGLRGHRADARGPCGGLPRLNANVHRRHCNLFLFPITVAAVRGPSPLSLKGLNNRNTSHFPMGQRSGGSCTCVRSQIPSCLFSQSGIGGCVGGVLAKGDCESVKQYFPPLLLFFFISPVVVLLLRT